MLPVVADVEVFGVGSAGDGSHELLCGDVDYTDSVGAFVCRWKRAFVDVWASDGRSAKGDVERFVVGAWMDAARPFSKVDSSDHIPVSAVDYGEVPGNFVGYIYLRGRGYGSRKLFGLGFFLCFAADGDSRAT